MAGFGLERDSVLDGLLEVVSHHDLSHRLRWWMRDPEKEVGFLAGYQSLLAVGRTHPLVAGSRGAAAAVVVEE